MRPGPTPAKQRCRHHPRELAGWRCDGCEADLCPDCVAGTQVGGVKLAGCARCGGHVRQLMLSRSAVPFSRRVLGAWRYPFNTPGLLAVAGLGSTLWLLSHFGCAGMFVAVGIFWASMFAAIRQSGHGANEIDIPDFSELGSSLLMPAVNGLVGTAILWVPGLLWASFGHRGGELLKDPVLWVLILAGVVYAPMALLAAATNSGLLRMLNPVAIIANIRQLGRDYAVAVAALVVLGALDALVLMLSALAQAVPVPVVAALISSWLLMLVPLVMCRVLGLLLYVRGDELGWGVSHELGEPALPGVEPRGAASPRAGEEQTIAGGARRWAPIELDPESLPPLASPEVSGSFRLPAIAALDPSTLPPLARPEVSGSFRLPTAEGLDPDALPPLARAEVSGSFRLPVDDELDPEALPPIAPAEVSGAFRVATWELDPRWLPALAPAEVSGSFRLPTTGALDPSALPPLAEVAGELTDAGLDWAPAIAAAVGASQFHQACELYAAASNLSALSLSPEVHFAVGQSAANSGNFPLAVRALKAAATHADSPLAPSALVVLGRVYGERLGDREAATRLFVHVVNRYPGTEAARFAEGRLASQK